MFNTKFNNTFWLSLLIFIFLFDVLYAKPIKYEGLKRLSLDDIQAITDYKLDEDNFTNKTVN